MSFCRPNILLITADDMNWDAVGAYDCPVEGTTPNIDSLAGDGMRFNYGHVTIAVCQPSRSAIMTGRYPHRSGGEGFFNLRYPDIPFLPEVLRNAGYYVGILGKVKHSTPYAEFEWDMNFDQAELGQGRNPELYRSYAGQFMRNAKELSKPFFLMLNSHDPHRPFFGNDKPHWYEEGGESVAVAPSLVFKPEEVVVPGFLADLPDVRLEISEYYSSVRRCDDTVGAALDALRGVGAEDNTIVIFLSDNGMAFPFSKTNCYLHSTKTPFIVRWPGKIRPGSVDGEHFVSGIDMMPTLLEAVGVEAPSGMDGRSFLPVLRGEKQDGRQFVFTQFHQVAGKRNYPMRCIQNRRFGYIFNPWSNGDRIFKNESQAGRTMKAMREAAERDPNIAARIDLFLKRIPEEFYEFQNDPDALHNLINDKQYSADLRELQAALELWMEETGDPALEAFRNRNSPEALDRFMATTTKSLGGTI